MGKTLKKILIPTLAMASLVLMNINDKKEEAILANKEIVEHYFPSSTKPDSKIGQIRLQTIQNDTYLLENIQDKPYLMEEEYLREKNSEFIKQSNHIYIGTDNLYDVSELSLAQLQRIYLLYEYLNDPSSIQKIGKLIEDDIADPYAEHGGIIDFEKNKLYFKTFESTLKKDTSENGKYNPPFESFITPNIAFFHLHAVEYNEEKYAGPSLLADILASADFINKYGESHEVVITSIEKGKFNIDYYGGNKFSNPFPKVFDLGTFSYDITKIK